MAVREKVLGENFQKPSLTRQKACNTFCMASRRSTQLSYSRGAAEYNPAVRGCLRSRVSGHRPDDSAVGEGVGREADLEQAGVVGYGVGDASVAGLAGGDLVVPVAQGCLADA